MVEIYRKTGTNVKMTVTKNMGHFSISNKGEFTFEQEGEEMTDYEIMAKAKKFSRNKQLQDGKNVLDSASQVLSQSNGSNFKVKSEFMS
jgi:hypothetical protein